ncbi:hypothetical protein PG984_013637 [Apiospora sp. TS-2023a]
MVIHDVPMEAALAAFEVNPLGEDLGGLIGGGGGGQGLGGEAEDGGWEDGGEAHSALEDGSRVVLREGDYA